MFASQKGMAPTHDGLPTPSWAVKALKGHRCTNKVMGKDDL